MSAGIVIGLLVGWSSGAATCAVVDLYFDWRYGQEEADQ